MRGTHRAHTEYPSGHPDGGTCIKTRGCTSFYGLLHLRPIETHWSALPAQQLSFMPGGELHTLQSVLCVEPYSFWELLPGFPSVKRWSPQFCAPPFFFFKANFEQEMEE